MTSINAIRFNHYEGACICDESITSSDFMRLDVSDKIQSCVPPVVIEKYGVVAVLGTTGSCSMGAELKNSLCHRVGQRYEEELEKQGKAPQEFLHLSDMAKLAFDVIIAVKEEAVNHKFQHKYGFSSQEFLQGKYEKEGKNVSLNDKDTVEEISALLSWKHQQEEMSFVFNNAALLAGYDEKEGVGLYHFDLRGGYWEKIQTCYFAEGSGRHSVDPAMYPFVENLLLEKRRGEVDRVDGLMSLIHSMNMAVNYEIGVAGYPNIIIINGRENDPTKRLREIQDESSLLASQIMRAIHFQQLSYKEARTLIDNLIYQGAPQKEIYGKMLQQSRSAKALSRILRGYKVFPYQSDELSS